MMNKNQEINVDMDIADNESVVVQSRPVEPDYLFEFDDDGLNTPCSTRSMSFMSIKRTSMAGSLPPSGIRLSAQMQPSQTHTQAPSNASLDATLLNRKRAENDEEMDKLMRTRETEKLTQLQQPFKMYMGPVRLVDSLFFVLCLAWQLPLQAGLFSVVLVALRALPFLCRTLPFWQHASMFEMVVIRFARYAFVNIPPRVSRVFLSKEVTEPFVRFRVLRHGATRQAHWRTHTEPELRGVWIHADPDMTRKPDICVYYLHGGGFCMGSPYFYLEFLLAWVEMLRQMGYQNPAIFALDYSLVPEHIFPTQLGEALAGYKHVLETIGSASKVCISGDSAGASLALSLLLLLAQRSGTCGHDSETKLPGPHMAVMLSPWATMVSDKQHNTSSDFIDATTLRQWAAAYAGDRSLADPLVSPGSYRDVSAWVGCGVRRFMFMYGSEEVLAADTAEFADRLARHGLDVEQCVMDKSVHVWPVISLYVSESAHRRFQGLQTIVQSLVNAMPPSPPTKSGGT